MGRCFDTLAKIYEYQAAAMWIEPIVLPCAKLATSQRLRRVVGALFTITLLTTLVLVFKAKSDPALKAWLTNKVVAPLKQGMTEASKHPILTITVYGTAGLILHYHRKIKYLEEDKEELEADLYPWNHDDLKADLNTNFGNFTILPNRPLVLIDATGTRSMLLWPPNLQGVSDLTSLELDLGNFTKKGDFKKIGEGVSQRTSKKNGRVHYRFQSQV